MLQEMRNGNAPKTEMHTLQLRHLCARISIVGEGAEPKSPLAEVQFYRESDASSSGALTAVREGQCAGTPCVEAESRPAEGDPRQTPIANCTFDELIILANLSQQAYNFVCDRKGLTRLSSKGLPPVVQLPKM